MIIPIRCFTCGKVLADKWEYYVRKSMNDNDKDNPGSQQTQYKNIEPTNKKQIFEDLELNKMCCRRHMLGHIDLIEKI
jgi:DNA-directed RNA polymerase I, II, and III subunit RPABC5